eukprot:3994941-Prymnesium_polylepis.1
MGLLGDMGDWGQQRAYARLAMSAAAPGVSGRLPTARAAPPYPNMAGAALIWQAPTCARCSRGVPSGCCTYRIPS